MLCVVKSIMGLRRDGGTNSQTRCVFKGIAKKGVVRCERSPFWILRKGKSSLTFRKNPVRIISLELFWSSKFLLPHLTFPPYSSNFSQGNMAMEPPRLLVLSVLAPCTSVDPLSKKSWWHLRLLSNFKTF